MTLGISWSSQSALVLFFPFSCVQCVVWKLEIWLFLPRPFSEPALATCKQGTDSLTYVSPDIHHWCVGLGPRVCDADIRQWIPGAVCKPAVRGDISVFALPAAKESTLCSGASSVLSSDGSEGTFGWRPMLPAPRATWDPMTCNMHAVRLEMAMGTRKSDGFYPT